MQFIPLSASTLTGCQYLMSNPEGRKFLYADDNHLSDDGSELTRPLFEDAIRDAISAVALK